MEESIQQYINKRIEKRNEKLEKDIDEKQVNQFIGLVVSTIIFTVGAATTPLAPTIGLVIASVAAAMACLKVRNCLKLEGQADRLKNEVKHLKELENGVEDKNNTKDKRVHQLISLDHSKQEAKEEYAKAKKITFLTYGLTAVGVGATIVNPALAVIVIPGITANILAVRNEVNKANACEEIRREISDINHELDIINIQEGYATNEEKEKQKKLEEQKKSEKEKVFGVTYEEFKKIYEDNKGFDVKYPNDKPKQFIKK